jgi:hypothetical protein
VLLDLENKYIEKDTRMKAQDTRKAQAARAK